MGKSLLDIFKKEEPPATDAAAVGAATLGAMAGAYGGSKLGERLADSALKWLQRQNEMVNVPVMDVDTHAKMLWPQPRGKFGAIEALGNDTLQRIRGKAAKRAYKNAPTLNWPGALNQDVDPNTMIPLARLKQAKDFVNGIPDYPEEYPMREKAQASLDKQRSEQTAAYKTGVKSVLKDRADLRANTSKKFNSRVDKAARKDAGKVAARILPKKFREGGRLAGNIAGALAGAALTHALANPRARKWISDKLD